MIELLKFLESDVFCQRHGGRSFGIAESTMEQVFMNVTTEYDNNNEVVADDGIQQEEQNNGRIEAQVLLLAFWLRFFFLGGGGVTNFVTWEICGRRGTSGAD